VSNCCRACTQAGRGTPGDRIDWHRDQQIKILNRGLVAIAVVGVAIVAALIVTVVAR